jgi:hypothetical protein
MKQRILLVLNFIAFGTFAQSSGSLTVSMKPWGPSPADMDKIIAPVEGSLRLQGLLGNSDYRLLDYRLLDENVKGSRTILPPSVFEMMYYNYATNKAFLVTGELKEPLNMKIMMMNEQPPTNQEEFNHAVEILKKDAKYGPAIGRGEVIPFQPLPPTASGPNNERLVVVGIRSETPGISEGLIGVNMTRKQVSGPLENAGYNGMDALSTTCDVPNASGCWNFIGFGAVEVVIKDGSDTLWTFHALRPGSSSGNMITRSGIEVRHVRYKGKMVMWRGHMPILNVKYKNNLCGPYRDWMFEESCFDAVGTQVLGTGFINCSQKPETILEHPNSDGGNFAGVAVWADSNKVTLISELEAGWYRYITEWRFYEDGVIEPIIGFGATYNTCTCNEHYHHGYWRLDFDVDSYDQNTAEQFEDSSGTWVKIKTVSPEEKQYRDSTKTSKWRVKRDNSVYYDIVPGPEDGTATGDAFGKGDLWFLKYNLNELDDNVTCIYGGGCLNGDVTANISKFMNNEAINNKDVVVWYGVHKTHVLTEDHGGAARRGPRLVPSANFNSTAPAVGPLPIVKREGRQLAAGVNTLSQAERGPKVEVFPNPASNSFDLKLSSVGNGKPVSVKVFDLEGKVVFETVTSAAAKPQMDLNIHSGEWKDGIYIIEVNNSEWIVTRKLIKQTR